MRTDLVPLSRVRDWLLRSRVNVLRSH